jgi:hypothetical protein
MKRGKNQKNIAPILAIFHLPGYDFCINIHTILSFEDDFTSSSFKSLPQWWIFRFEQRNEERNEGEWRD